MAIQTPVVRIGSKHRPILAGDTIDPANLPSFPSLGAATIANNTTINETVVASWTVPANYLTLGKLIKLAAALQSGGTGTMIFRIRCGTTGTITDALIAQFSTSAALVVNRLMNVDVNVFVTSVGATGSIYSLGEITVGTATLNRPDAATASVTVNTTVANVLTITAQCSVAQANVTRAAGSNG